MQTAREAPLGLSGLASPAPLQRVWVSPLTSVLIGETSCLAYPTGHEELGRGSCALLLLVLPGHKQVGFQAQLVLGTVSPQPGIIGPYPRQCLPLTASCPTCPARVTPHPSSLRPHTAPQISGFLGF